MSAVKYWDGGAWQTMRSVQGPVGPQGPPGVGAEPSGPAGGGLGGSYPNPTVKRESSGGLLGVQRDWGRRDLYQTAANGGAVFRDGVDWLAIGSGAPAVPFFWVVTTHLGIVDCTGAAYNYLYLYANLYGGADQDGYQTGSALNTQHSGVVRYSHREITRIFRLPAGQYTHYATTGFAAGTWTYHQGTAFMWMEGRTWAQ